MVAPPPEPGWESCDARPPPMQPFRYALWRPQDERRPTVQLVALDPSTADDRRDGPTIRRCIGFAREWGTNGALHWRAHAVRPRIGDCLRLGLAAAGAPRHPLYVRRDVRLRPFAAHHPLLPF